MGLSQSAELVSCGFFPQRIWVTQSKSAQRHSRVCLSPWRAWYHPLPFNCSNQVRWGPGLGGLHSVSSHPTRGYLIEVQCHLGDSASGWFWVAGSVPPWGLTALWGAIRCDGLPSCCPKELDYLCTCTCMYMCECIPSKNVYLPRYDLFACTQSLSVKCFNYR